MRISLFAFAAAMVAGTCCASQPPRPKHAAAPASKRAPAGSTVPDLIYFNGIIYTGNGFAEDKPETVEAIAVGGGKVLAVGTTHEITRLAGADYPHLDPKNRHTDENHLSWFH